LKMGCGKSGRVMVKGKETKGMTVLRDSVRAFWKKSDCAHVVRKTSRLSSNFRLRTSYSAITDRDRSWDPVATRRATVRT
jgi:hypothetical protein